MAQNSGKQSDRNANGAQNAGFDGAQRAGQVLEDWGSRVGRGIAAAAARVREEVEDVWAEAQSIRRGESE